MSDFEVIVVNDGSTDRTRAILASLAAREPRVRLINHEINQGYGAALVSGFRAASKELTFFMDSDGQFDIHDLQEFFSFIDEYNAVIGYRIERQDTWMQDLPASLRKQIEEMGGIGGGFGGQGGQSAQLTTWVQHTCKVVPGSLWQTATPTGSASTGGAGANTNQLYDCSSIR